MLYGRASPPRGINRFWVLWHGVISRGVMLSYGMLWYDAIMPTQRCNVPNEVGATVIVMAIW